MPQLSEQALKEKAQKEKMAAGLFGGISANSKPVTIKPKAGVNAPAATPMKQSLSKGSLIDTDSPLISMTLSQPAIQASKPATGGGLFDSMEVRAPTVPSSSGGGLMTWGSPAPAPVTSPTPAPSIFASTVMHTPPPVPQTAPSPMSLFDGMIASPVIAPAPVIAPVVTPTMSASNNHGGLLDMESSVMRPMSVSVDSFDSSSTPHMNAPMQAPVHTVPTPILTQSPVMIPQSSVGGGGSGGGGGLATISMGMNPIFIKPNTVTDAFADMNKLSLEPTVSLPQPNISISSISTATSGPATGGIRLSPLQITTQEFGQKWGQLAAEVKGSCSSNISILAELSTVFPSIYHNVESIHATNESIFAASGNVGSIVVLVHLKVHAAKKSIDITVKSTTRQICADLLKSIISALSSSSS